jgi:hypothetical protein
MTGAILLLIGSLIVGFVIAVGIGIIIKLSLNHHRPRLHIDHNTTINITEFDQLAPDERKTTFWANRIRVRNPGQSAATDCKA